MKRLPIFACSTFAIGLLVSALGGSALAQGNSSVGNWDLNVVQSTYSPGPAPKSSTLKIEAVGKAVNSTVDTVLEDGSTQHITYGGAYDRKDVAATGSPTFDMVSRRRISPTTTEATYKKAGKIVTVNTVVVSADGKTLTNTAKGTDAQGHPVNNVQVYIKQ
jgi:hypothetical protein